MSARRRVLVAGGGGFIGSHLTNRLVAEGHEVWATDIKPLDEWAQVNQDAYNFPSQDLRKKERAMYAVGGGIDDVYMLAADMGGMGYIETHKLACMVSSLISTHMLLASIDQGVKRYFYSSSACVYAAGKQSDTNIMPLRESDAYPAMPEDGYGWEKLFAERFCRHAAEETNLVTRVARFHNVYGPNTHWDGGREKAPAAICRKVIQAKKSGDPRIEIWGDGLQTRSFMEVDDCVEGIRRIMESDISYPINLGSNELVTINQLVSIAEQIAGIELTRSYRLDAPQGVRGRNSDNHLIRQELDWEPTISLQSGMERLYRFVWDEMSQV